MIKKTIAIACLFCGLMGMNAAYADIPFKGSLEIAAPVYYNGTPDRAQDRTPSVAGNLSFPNLIGSVTPSFSYRYSTNRHPKNLYWKENRFTVTLDTPLTPSRDWILFGSWERRDYTGQDRFLVGLRYNFVGRLR